MKDFETPYSQLDRVVRKLAMGQLGMQQLLSRLESNWLRRNPPGIAGADAVFTTSLSRAGTAHLLEVVASAPELVSHTYGDMLHILRLLIWDRLSRGFYKPTEERERAHGDSMLVSYDSVATFEEALWHFFWPDHHEASRIREWLPDERGKSREFSSF